MIWETGRIKWSWFNIPLIGQHEGSSEQTKVLFFLNESSWSTHHPIRKLKLKVELSSADEKLEFNMAVPSRWKWYVLDSVCTRWIALDAFALGENDDNKSCISRRCCTASGYNDMIRNTI